MALIDDVLVDLEADIENDSIRAYRRDPYDETEPYEYTIDVSAGPGLGKVLLEMNDESGILTLVMKHRETGVMASTNVTAKPALQDVYDACKAKDTTIKSTAIAALASYLDSLNV